MKDCIFCKIINKELPSTIVYEDDDMLAFVDLYPKAKHHYLLIPKKHIATLNDAVETPEILGMLFAKVPTIARKLGFYDFGYKVTVHCNDGGGQEIYHLHLHILSNYPD